MGIKYASIEKPWLKFYSSSSNRAELPKMTAYEYMAICNSDNLDNLALEYYGYTKTFKEFLKNINEVAQAFYNIGVREGDVVTIISVATPELEKSFYALNRIGAVLNLVDVRSDAKTLKKYIDETNSRVVIVLDNFISEFNKIVNQTDVYKVITVSPYNSIPSFKRRLANMKYKKSQEYRINSDIKRDSLYIEWNEFLTIPVIEKVNYTSYKENMEAVYVHTGGTTGVSKTVRLSNDNMNAISFQYKLFKGEYDKGETFFNDIVPFVAFLVRRAIPVLGTLYCLGTGYILGFIASSIVDYRTILLIAVVITMAIVAAMCVLYASGIVKVTKKFRTVVLTLLLASILMSGIVCVCAFIPGLREVALFFQNNTILGILGSVAGIIIASLFLLADFNTVQYIVENGLPKKYEWIAAFGLVFTIVWIYFKVLDLLARAKNNNNK